MSVDFPLPIEPNMDIFNGNIHRGMMRVFPKRPTGSQRPILPLILRGESRSTERLNSPIEALRVPRWCIPLRALDCDRIVNQAAAIRPAVSAARDSKIGVRKTALS